MKIKIIESKNKTKNLKERQVLLNIEDVGSFLDKIEQKISRNFQNLIFYDLETMGFLPDNYIHQFAALSFTLNEDGSGLKTYTPKTGADSGILLKSEFNTTIPVIIELQEKSKDSRDVFVSQIQNMQSKSVKQKNAQNYMINFGVPAFNKLKDLIQTYLEGEEKYNIIGTDRDILSSSYVLLDIYSQNAYYKIKNLIVQLEVDKNELGQNDVGAFKDLFESNGPLSPNSIKNLNLNDNNNLNDFKKALLDFKQHIQNFKSISTELRLINSSKLIEAVDVIFRRFNIRIGMTFLENKYFTNYDKFPSQKFIGIEKNTKLKYMDPKSGNTILRTKSEKENINAFLDYLGKQPDDKIIIGHNIGSFDNKVIIVRARRNNINNEKIDKFQDYRFIDTLTLFNFFKTQMTSIEQSLNKFISEKDFGRKKTKKNKFVQLKAQVTQIFQTWKQPKHPMKVKLEQLMKLFEETKNSKQQHTADDDCYQLAQVTIALITEFSKIIKSLKDLIEGIRPDIITKMNKDYDENRINTSFNSKSLVTKVKGDLNYIFTYSVFPQDFVQWKDDLSIVFGKWEEEEEDSSSSSDSDVLEESNNSSTPWDVKKQIEQKLAATRDRFVYSFIRAVINKKIKETMVLNKQNGDTKSEPEISREAAESIALSKRQQIAQYFLEALQGDEIVTTRGLLKNKTLKESLEFTSEQMKDLYKELELTKDIIKNIENDQAQSQQAAVPNVTTSPAVPNNPPPLQENKRIIKVRII